MPSSTLPRPDPLLETMLTPPMAQNLGLQLVTTDKITAGPRFWCYRTTQKHFCITEYHSVIVLTVSRRIAELVYSLSTRN